MKFGWNTDNRCEVDAAIINNEIYRLMLYPTTGDFTALFCGDINSDPILYFNCSSYVFNAKQKQIGHFTYDSIGMEAKYQLSVGETTITDSFIIRDNLDVYFQIEMRIAEVYLAALAKLK